MAENPKSHGKSLVEVSYRRAKASKGADRLMAAGKITKMHKVAEKKKHGSKKNPSKAKEKDNDNLGPKKGRKPGVARKAFKSKSR